MGELTAQNQKNIKKDRNNSGLLLCATVFRWIHKIRRKADLEAIADAILTLKENDKLRNRIAENGHELFKEKLAIHSVGRSLESPLMELI